MRAGQPCALPISTWRSGEVDPGEGWEKGGSFPLVERRCRMKRRVAQCPVNAGPSLRGLGFAHSARSVQVGSWYLSQNLSKNIFIFLSFFMFIIFSFLPFFLHDRVSVFIGKIQEQCATRNSCGVCWARRWSCRGLPVVSVLRATHSLPGEPGTGVLWVLTGTHPCDTSIQAGWWRYQSASCYVRCACAGVVVYVIVPERGCFVVSCCLVSANQEKNTNTTSKTN